MEEIICTYDHIFNRLVTQDSGQACQRLDNFIQCWNNQTNRHRLLIDVKSDFNLRIVYHNCKNLYDGNEYNFGQDYYVKEQPVLLPPTIHLTEFRIFENQFSKEESMDGNNMEYYMADCVRRYKKVIDSSIWNYYVPIITKESKFDFEHFNHALCKIVHNYNEERYNLNITFEYADLNARLFKQSYLKGNHNAVSAFVFHSENEMKDKLQKLGLNGEYTDQKKVINEVKRYKWRFLLIDDKSLDRMSGTKIQKVDKCKVQIIYDNLHCILGFDEDKIWFRTFNFKSVRESNDEYRIIDKESGKTVGSGKDNYKVDPLILYGRVINGQFGSKPNEKFYPSKLDSFSTSDDIQVIIDCVKHVDAAQYCLQKYKYDIILIDYLLDKDKIKGEHNQEYGYYLLKELYDWHKNQNTNLEGSRKNEADYKIGPNDSLSMMFISAFTTSVHERIIEMGIGRSEPDLWYIGDGACPTNTPYLFSYLLLQLMKHRIKDLARKTEGEQMTIIGLLEQIYVKTDDRVLERVRKEANSHFNHLLFMRDKYSRLENDLSIDDERYIEKNPNDAKYMMNMKSSLLVYSTFKVVHHFSNAFFDHLQHLVYLTAFGTIRQWQEMWEEYIFVYKGLYEYDNKVLVNGKKQDRGKKICNAIKEYIISLKENSN